MKAIVYEKYGPPEVLQIRELAKPVPADNEVLVKVCAATVTLYDCMMRSCKAPTGFGLFMRLASGVTGPRKKVLGTELAGEVEAVGKNVILFKAGDKVFVYTGMKSGAYAGYICFPEDGAMALRPSNITCEEAASVLQGALTALFFLRKGNIGSGQKVLVFGASGGVGSAAVQLAKCLGAEVTGVCSTGKMEFVKSLGADKVIDYTREDFTGSGETYDIILDTIGRSPVSGCRKALKRDGYYLVTTFGLPRLLRLLWFSVIGRRKLFIGTLKERPEDMVYLRELIEAGKFKPVIDRSFSMEEAAEAHRYVETGQKTGTVVITIDNSA